MKYILSLLAAVAFALSGCAAIERIADRVASHELLLHVAVAEHINRDVQKADDVLAFVEEARTVLDTEISLSLADISAEMQSKINWNKLSPGSEILVREIIREIELEMAKYEVEGSLSLEGTESLGKILDIIERAAFAEKSKLQ